MAIFSPLLTCNASLTLPKLPLPSVFKIMYFFSLSPSCCALSSQSPYLAANPLLSAMISLESPALGILLKGVALLWF